MSLPRSPRSYPWGPYPGTFPFWKQSFASQSDRSWGDTFWPTPAIALRSGRHASLLHGALQIREKDVRVRSEGRGVPRSPRSYPWGPLPWHLPVLETILCFSVRSIVRRYILATACNSAALWPSCLIAAWGTADTRKRCASEE
jgi:hypothetical protein